MNASSWSSRVPQSLQVKVEDDSVTVTANQSIAPQARAFELGIRHPLNYPNQHGQYASTPHRPFLEDALAERTDIATNTIADVVFDWAQERGWRRT